MWARKAANEDDSRGQFSLRMTEGPPAELSGGMILEINQYNPS